MWKKRYLVIKQCELVGLNRSRFYYESKINHEPKLKLLKAIDGIYTEIPFYGYRKVHQQLIESGFAIGVNRVRSYMQELGLKTIYPTKAILSHKLSNTMDSTLVLEVLKKAIGVHGKPEIFNTDQGSQYTSRSHTQLLTD